MYQSMVVYKEDVNLNIGDTVRLLSYSEIENNSSVYNFELNPDVNYEDYYGIDLKVIDIVNLEIRDDLKILSLKVEADEDIESTWLFYNLEVTCEKNPFSVELL